MHVETTIPMALRLVRRRISADPLAWLLFALCVLFPLQPVLAQNPLESAETVSQAPEEWQPPPITDLPASWWSPFTTEAEGLRTDRIEQFLSALKQRANGLVEQNLVVAQNSLNNLENLYELLQVAAKYEPAGAFEPVPTKESYGLDDILQLQDQWRTLEKEQSDLRVQISQTDRQLGLLEERRDNLFRRYQAADIESPERILAGIERVSARIEYALTRKQLENLESRLREAREYSERVEQQMDYARQHLGGGEVSLDSLQAAIEKAHAASLEKSREVATFRKQLLDVLSADDVNRSLEVLRKQQLTRASAAATLAELEEAVLRASAAWQRLRAGEPDSEFDPRSIEKLIDNLTREALDQVEVWYDTTQTTLVASQPADNLNAAKNFEIARSVARDTLALIEEIRNASDELQLVRGILTDELIASQSGLSKAWASIKVSAAAIWGNVAGIIDYELFNIGDNPVTPGAIFKMLLILVFAFAISWFIRHLLDHATGRQQFAQSPVIYTTGRIAHYIIVLIGVFVALGSIGMDFTNFALIAGALSVGIGFGLQAIVNNFVSGLILLFEGSLRIGDYIELDSGLAGVVKEINTRATVVNSNDGVDVVVPNSELVTTKLTNLTLRESMGRIRVPFGVAYGSDKELVKEAALKAAEQMDFILLKMRGREPQVRLVNFGDSALEFELLAWLNRQGVRRPHRVRASFLWALETELGKAGIEIPFPQRDVHIRDQAAPDPSR